MAPEARLQSLRMSPTPPSVYERYQPWRRQVEVGFWLLVTLVNTLGNSITVLVDVRRTGLPFADWEPLVWESSSALLWLGLIPGIAWFSSRYPLHWGSWCRQLVRHLLASALASLLHVLGMVALRELVYRFNGRDYDFGPWSVALSYEYLKDVRSYASIVFVMEAYRLLLRRAQGEVRLLDMPDEGPPLEPVERPERFLVRKLGRDFLVAAADIEWLQAQGNYVNLHLRGHDYPLRSTIGGIEARLDPARFARIHRSFIVNLDHVASIEPLDSGEARVHLRDGHALPCSRSYRAALRGRVDG